MRRKPIPVAYSKRMRLVFRIRACPRGERTPILISFVHGRITCSVSEKLMLHRFRLSNYPLFVLRKTFPRYARGFVLYSRT